MCSKWKKHLLMTLIKLAQSHRDLSASAFCFLCHSRNTMPRTKDFISWAVGGAFVFVPLTFTSSSRGWQVPLVAFSCSRRFLAWRLWYALLFFLKMSIVNCQCQSNIMNVATHSLHVTWQDLTDLYNYTTLHESRACLFLHGLLLHTYALIATCLIKKHCTWLGILPYFIQTHIK